MYKLRMNSYLQTCLDINTTLFLFVGARGHGTIEQSCVRYQSDSNFPTLLYCSRLIPKMVWKSWLSPEEHDSSYRIEWGSKVAKLLDCAKVPYVAWGDLMDAHLCADFRTERTLCFVVPDNRLDAAIRALRLAGLSEDPCRVDFCDWAGSPDSGNYNSSPWPAHHFHFFRRCQDFGRETTVCYPIGLLRKSQWLWLLPDPPLDFPEPNDPNFMLSTDRRHPDWDMKGFGNSFYPIKLLTPARWIESLFCQVIRDKSTIDRLQCAWFRPVQRFHERLARLLPPELFHLDLLQEPFRTIYKLKTYQLYYCPDYLLAEKMTDRLWEEWQEAGSMPDPVYPYDIENCKRMIEKARRRYGYSRDEISKLLRIGSPLTIATDMSLRGRRWSAPVLLFSNGPDTGFIVHTRADLETRHSSITTTTTVDSISPVDPPSHPWCTTCSQRRLCAKSTSVHMIVRRELTKTGNLVPQGSNFLDLPPFSSHGPGSLAPITETEGGDDFKPGVSVTLGFIPN
ncbi:hypothetical protein ASPBRDRAFT_677735 [Aspergillus brasiliensis CBS 101740]|uniref:Uncharacterized protein n=1 Tax=Aspergillus brasiliensis (strain CBS 101740 / IMI 381727 / IBT 21946) TaxID=767769 RepID=A0A1L9UGF1_ASPBC|nr:hypothetical protein ASPBRDRAFT_677735 [Aspergillus brasiliensis CBS 101740]